MKKILSTILLLCPLGAWADVNFYGQCEYKGPSVALAPGDYTAADLQKMGIPEDVIASIDVPRGHVVTVFEDDNFKGRYGTLRRSDSCLDNDRFSRVISSVSIRESFGLDSAEPSLPQNESLNVNNAVTVYSECEYRGQSASFPAGDYNLAQLEKLGITNNSISSVKVPAGFSVKLFENDFLLGRAGVLQSNDNCLKDDRFDNVISSLSVSTTQAKPAIVVPKPKPKQTRSRAPVTLFTQCDFKSGAVALKEGEYSAEALKKLGLANNSVSSIQVQEGYQIELFENDFFLGRSGTLRQDDPCLIDDRFNDAITSVVVSRSSHAIANQPTAANSTTTATVAPASTAMTVYAYCNFKGTSVPLPAGQFNLTALLRSLIENNVISSFKLADGYQVTLYDQDNFAGNGKTFVQNDDCLDDDEMDDKVSSLVIAPVVAKSAESVGGGNLREFLEPLRKPATSNNMQAFNTALACVEQYVERDICDSARWRDMHKRCQLSGVELLDDGYLKGHIDAGNCKKEYWSELSRRTANPKLR